MNTAARNAQEQPSKHRQERRQERPGTQERPQLGRSVPAFLTLVGEERKGTPLPLAPKKNNKRPTTAFTPSADGLPISATLRISVRPPSLVSTSIIATSPPSPTHTGRLERGGRGRGGRSRTAVEPPHGTPACSRSLSSAEPGRYRPMIPGMLRKVVPLAFIGHGVR